MKFRSPLRVALAGIMAMSAPVMAASSDVGAGEVASPVAQKHVPHPVPKFTIDLSDMGRGSFVHKTTFSPDGNYLAIADMPDLSTATIIVWDLRSNREVTRIKGLPPFAVWPQVKLIWSPDGKYLTYGTAGTAGPMRFWDPITGQVKKELDVIGSRLQYNKDGSKLFLKKIHREGGFRVYDTSTWGFKDFDHDGLTIQTLAWTADDKILVAGTWPRESVGKKVDGLTPKMFDVLARLIDPSGYDSSRSVVMAPSAPRAKDGVLWPTFSPTESLSDFAGNKVVISTLMLDGRTLEVLYNFATDEDIKRKKRLDIGNDGFFSPDGAYLYLPRFKLNCEESKIVIVDVATNEDAGIFYGGCRGMSISNDGKKLAVGNRNAVNILDMQ